MSINEDFNNLDNWVVSDWSAPQGGLFKTERVDIISNELRLKLTQTNNAGIKSVGGEVRYKDLTHFGTYKCVMKASSVGNRPNDLGRPWSGSCSAFFLYVNDSETEIDFEIEGCRSSVIHCNNWATTEFHTHTKKDLRVALSGSFMKYKIVWMPDHIKYFVNDKLIAKHTTNIPQAPAYPMFNHWGTNNVNWGGLATLDIDRFMFVKKFTYEPL